MLTANQPLALYMEGNIDADPGKMGFGILRYSPNPVACVIDSPHAGKDAADITGIPRSAPVVATIDEAVAHGAQVLVLGIAPAGGLIPEAWYAVIHEAVSKGLSIINGLHDQLSPRFTNLKPGQWIWDIRVEPEGLAPSTGEALKLGNRRVLMIGTDMAVGKMTAGLEIWKAARERGLRAEFVATGQIGIAITGGGVPLDAIRVDYASGAIEREMLKHRDAELVIIEGQGALVHPGSSANLPLLRGAMPTHLILCHRAGLLSLKRGPWVRIPPLKDYIGLYEDLAEACGTFPRPKTSAVAVDTRGYSDDETTRAIEGIERDTGLPATDPVRFGPQKLLDSLV